MVHLVYKRLSICSLVCCSLRYDGLADCHCKVFYPLAYYAAFFSIRASGFSYELMCQGREKLEVHLADYKKRSDTLSKKSRIRCGTGRNCQKCQRI